MSFKAFSILQMVVAKDYKIYVEHRTTSFDCPEYYYQTSD